MGSRGIVNPPKRKAYSKGGPVTVNDLTPEQKAEYDGLDPAAQADFLKLLGEGKGLNMGDAAAGAAKTAIPYETLGNLAGAGVEAIDQADGKKSKAGMIGSSALKGAGTGAAIGSVVPVIGTGVGAAIGAVAGAIGGNIAANKAKRQQQANRVAEASGLAAANTMNPDIDIQNTNSERVGLKEGGEVDGPGTAKSDSIKTKLKPGSFVVPAENSGIAKKLHAYYFGTPTKLKDGGKVPVSLSDGEFVFSPRQVAYLKQKGINLNELAPDAKSGNKMQLGGTVKPENLDKEIDGIQRWIRLYEQGKAPGGKPELADYKKRLAELTKQKADYLKAQDAGHQAAEKSRAESAKTKPDPMATWAFENRNKFKPGSNTRKIIDNYIAQITGKGGQRTAGGQAMDLSVARTNMSVLYNQVKNGKDPVASYKNDMVGTEAATPAASGGTEERANYVTKNPPPAAATTTTPAATDVSKQNNSPAPGAKKAPKRNTAPAAAAAAVAATPAVVAQDIKNSNEGVDFATQGLNRTGPRVDLSGATEEPGTGVFRKMGADPAYVPTEQDKIEGRAALQKAAQASGNTAAGSGSSPDVKKEQVATGENGFTRGMAILGATQAGIGLAQLLTSGKRPEDTVDPTLLLRRDEAIDDAKLKMDPAVEAAAKNTIELNRRGTQNAIWNATAGDVGTGVAGSIAANTEANRGTIALAAEKERLGMIKNERADNLTGAVAGARRNIFLDKLEGFKENQKAMAELTQAGINNYIESRRLANSNKNLALIEAMDNGNITEADILALSRSRKT